MPVVCKADALHQASKEALPVLQDQTSISKIAQSNEDKKSWVYTCEQKTIRVGTKIIADVGSWRMEIQHMSGS